MGELTEADIEGEAELVYRAAAHDLDTGAHPAALAERLLGAGCVRPIRGASLPGWACLARVGGSWRIYVRAGAPESRLRWLVAHELGHYVLGPEAREQDCDRFGAALIAPRRAFQRAVRVIGGDWLAAASHFGISESWAALRSSEVSGEPLALVSGQTVRVRGEAFAWPSTVAGFRDLTRTGRADIRCARLRDDRTRIALLGV